MQIRPKTGDLLIWNSEYRHMVPETIYNTKRIAIAGNLGFHEESLKPLEILNA